MADEATLTIDDREVTVGKDATIFEAARSVGIDIPHLCYDPDVGLAPTSSCRLCVVEVEGAKSLAASCSTRWPPVWWSTLTRRRSARTAAWSSSCCSPIIPMTV